jgi:hypothetical protein
MPIDRHNGRVPNHNGHIVIHEPGAYAYTLAKVCDLEAHRRSGYNPLIDECVSVAELDREHAELKAAAMAERAGQPIRCLSWQLPSGLPAPFEAFPQHRRPGSFTVTPNDEITFIPREVRTA